jgi:DNA-binding beta-propeller fold protein YncE
VLCAGPARAGFDHDGALVGAWGGPGAGHPWPDNEHGIDVDERDHVWLAGNGPRDGMILKFSRDGKFLMKIGEPGVVGDDQDTRHLNRPANVVVDPATRELFVADGYGNHRVIVFDADTGAHKRHWGANGRPPGDASVKGSANPVHCVRLSRDGLLHVCDRLNNRLQVFRKDGTFGRNGRAAGQFPWGHNMAVDSAGNIYTTEVDTGKRAQKFVLKSR